MTLARGITPLKCRSGLLSPVRNAPLKCSSELVRPRSFSDNKANRVPRMYLARRRLGLDVMLQILTVRHLGLLVKGFLLSPVSFSQLQMQRETMAIRMSHHLYSFIKSRFLSGEGQSLSFFLLSELLLSA